MSNTKTQTIKRVAFVKLAFDQGIISAYMVVTMLEGIAKGSNINYKYVQDMYNNIGTLIHLNHNSWLEFHAELK